MVEKQTLGETNYKQEGYHTCREVKGSNSTPSTMSPTLGRGVPITSGFENLALRTFQFSGD